MPNNFESTKNKIKSHGYWKVRFYPTEFNDSLLSESQECLEMVRGCSVQLRGWDYPHVPTKDDELEERYIAGDRAESWIDWRIHKEIWRLFQNGQFIHYFAQWDDWYSEDDWLADNEYYTKIKPDTVFDAIGLVLRLTEIFLFLKNLVDMGLYSGNIKVEISLHNTDNRTLVLHDRSRIPFMASYRCRISDIAVVNKVLSSDEISLRYQELAREAAEYVFKQFQWTSFSSPDIAEDQRKLLERRM